MPEQFRHRFIVLEWHAYQLLKTAHNAEAIYDETEGEIGEHMFDWQVIAEIKSAARD